MPIEAIRFAADHCDLELIAAFWYTPGEDSPDDALVDPKIDFDYVVDIRGLTTASGLAIDADWLIDRGYYDAVLEFASKQIRHKLVPGSRLWQDLIGIAETFRSR